MKENRTCATERQVNGVWRPTALRYLRLTRQLKSALDRGETVEVDGDPIRRHDWAERLALRQAIGRR